MPVPLAPLLAALLAVLLAVLTLIRPAAGAFPPSTALQRVSTADADAFTGPAARSQPSASHRCLPERETAPQRFLHYGGRRLPLRLEASARLSQQLATAALRIFLAEALGYEAVQVVRAPRARAAAFRDVVLRLAGLQDDHSSPVPDIMINVEVWVPPENATSPFVADLGPIAFPGRYGWFIPREHAAPGRDTWRVFSQEESAAAFALAPDDMTLVREAALDEQRRSCSEGYCYDWLFEPAQCRAAAKGGAVEGPEEPCALLLAGFEEETGFVRDDVTELGLRVRVAWLGSRLAAVVRTLEARYRQRSAQPSSARRALVFLTGAPDQLVPSLSSPAYVAVAMPPCAPDCPRTAPTAPAAASRHCLRRCHYELHRRSKLAWPKIADSAKPAFEALEHMELDSEPLLALFAARGDGDVEGAACEWMRAHRALWEAWKPSPVERKELFIGGIFPMTGSSHTYHGLVKAAHLALDAVNRDDSLLPDFELKLKVDDGKCEAAVVMKTFIDYIMFNLYKNLVGILGPACSDTVEPLAGITKHFRTVVISYSAEGASFSDRNKYPYFFRTIGENKKYRHVYVHILKELQWKRVAALTEDGQKYTEYVALLQDELQNTGTFVYNRKFPREREKDAMHKYLEDIKLKNIRIIIGDVYDQAAREVMCQAYKMQMTARQGYVWFLPSWLSPDWYDTSQYINSINSTSNSQGDEVNCTTAEMIEAIEGHLALTHAYFAPDSDIMQEGRNVSEWRKAYENVCEVANVPVSNYAGYAYDAVWTYAYALDNLTRENASYVTQLHSDETTRRFVQVLEATDFHGVSGHIRFVSGGPSRVTTIHVMQWINKTMHIVGTFPPTNDDKWCCLNKRAIRWLTPDGKQPKDGTEPPQQCVLSSLAELMNGNCEAAIVVANVIGFGLFGILLIIAFVVLKRRYEQKVRQTEDYMKSLGIDLLVTSDLDKWEIPRDHVVINRKLGEGAFGTVYGGEAYFGEKGWVAVAVKTLKVGSTTEEKLDFLSEAEVMKRFEHKNIIKLLGVCTKNEPVYTVMEFMLYGDLKTFLLARRHLVNEKQADESDEISSKKLTSMVLDVARALSYLAELKYVHRDVASRNCLVNAARTVKLGDFGMTRPMFENDYYKFNRKGMLPVRWMAPESLRDGIFTPASDVWSFGVLLYEVITFGSFPFQGLSNCEVLEYVKAGNTLNVPVGVKPQLEALMRSCWCHDPRRRPPASELVEVLANSPRLLAPCLDAPAAAVPVDDEPGAAAASPALGGLRRGSAPGPALGPAPGPAPRPSSPPWPTFPPPLPRPARPSPAPDAVRRPLLEDCAVSAL